MLQNTLCIHESVLSIVGILSIAGHIGREVKRHRNSWKVRNKIVIKIRGVKQRGSKGNSKKIRRNKFSLYV